jgi:hypothetical protein
MKFKFFAFLCLSVLMSVSLAWADEAQDAQTFLERYLGAFQNKDKKELSILHVRLSESPKLLKYIEKNHPQEYLLIKAQSLVEKIELVKANAGEPLTVQPEIAFESKSLREAPQSNSDIASTQGLSNGEVVDAYPNAVRTDNRSMIDSRLKAGPNSAD